MANRLTVVVSQSSQRGALAKDLEETLVAELMMSPGLDATMVGPLDRINTDDTDFLCLNSFNHSFVVVTPLESDELAREWSRLSLTGEIVSLEHVGEAKASPGSAKDKRIYHLRLKPEARIPQLMSQILGILRDRNVRTISIGTGSLLKVPDVSRASELESESGSEQGLAGTLGKSAAPASAAPAQSPPEAGPPQDSSPAQSEIREGTWSAGEAESSGPPSEGEDDESSQWKHLDRLVEDLDALDL